MSEEQEFYAMMRSILENATDEYMDELEPRAQFGSVDSLLVFVIGYAMPPDENPKTLSAKWGISEAAARWILSRIVAGMVVPDVQSDECESA